MTIKIGASGAWKDVNKIHIGVSGAWKQVNAIWIGAGGAWKKLYDAILVQLSNASKLKTSISPADAYTGIRVNSSGAINTLENTALSWGGTDYNWLVVESASDYECRFTP